MRIIYLVVPLMLMIAVMAYVIIERETEAQTIVRLPKIVTWADNTVATMYAYNIWRVVYYDGVTCYGRGEYLTCFQRGE